MVFEMIIGMIYGLLMITLIVCVVGLIGNEVIYRMHCKLLDAMWKGKRNGLSPLFTNPLYIKGWTTIECCCPWMWRYKRYISADILEKLKPYMK